VKAGGHGVGDEGGVEDDGRFDERDADADLRRHRGQRLHEPLNRVLGRRICFVERLADHAAHTADRDDPSSPGVQMRYDGLGQRDDAEEVDLHVPDDLHVGQLQGHVAVSDSGAVRQRVEPDVPIVTPCTQSTMD
jgi:hypothetical protein